MIKSIKIVIILTATALLAWLLPWCYAFLFAAPTHNPFTLYSPLIHTFAWPDTNDNGKFQGRDLRGMVYQRRQFDSILPLFYSRQLASEGRFPAQIEGLSVDIRTAERSKFIFRSTPSQINRKHPALGQLLESMPGRVDLVAAEDVFRITDHAIEFVDMESNQIDAAKSEAFTRVFTDKGFTFPARILGGNPTIRKEYDNGYLIVDNASQLFHVKQMRGRPFVRKVVIPDGVNIRQIFVTEHSDRKLLGLFCDDNARTYALTADYVLHELPIGAFDPALDAITIIGDMFYWTLKISEHRGAERLVAINARDYSRVDEHHFPQTIGRWEYVAQYLFPFSLSFSSSIDAYIHPRIAHLSAHALWLALVLALCYALLKGKEIRHRAIELVGIILLGLFLFIPLLVFDKRR